MPAARRSAQGTGRLADLYASSKQRNLHGLTRKTRAQPNAWRKPALSLSAANSSPLLFCYRRASGIGQVDSHERYAFPATAHPPLASIADRGTRRHLVRAAGPASSGPERRRPLRRNGTRNVRDRRLDHAALQRLQVFRKTPAANLGERADVRVVRHRRMASAVVYGLDGLRWRAADRLYRRAGVQRRDGVLRGRRARDFAVLEPDGPFRYARHGPLVLDATHAVRLAAGAAAESAGEPGPSLDVALLGRHGTRAVVEGVDRADPAGRGTGAVHADHA